MFGQYAQTARQIASIAAQLESRSDTFAGPVGIVQYPSRTAGHPAHMLRIVVSRRDGIAGPAGTAYMTCNCDAQTRGFRMCYAMADTAYIFGGTVVPIHAGLHRAR